MRITKRLNALERAYANATSVSDDLQSALNDYFTNLITGRVEPPTCRCCTTYVTEGIAIIQALISTPPEKWPMINRRPVPVPDHLRRSLLNV